MKIKNEMCKRFEMNEFQEVQTFLEINIFWIDKGIFLHQHFNIEKLVNQFKMNDYL